VDRIEFATIMAYLSSACGKPMPANAAEVYYDLLGDLPVNALSIAAKRVALEHPWSTFPSIAELRAAAVATIQGEIKELSAVEAWEQAWSAAARIDLEVPHTIENAKAKVPPVVWDAMQCFGIPSLVCGREPLAVVRAQFLKVFEQLSARRQRENLLPGSMKKEIASYRNPSLPGRVEAIAGLIGSE
jgi:hypothetical protein